MTREHLTPRQSSAYLLAMSALDEIIRARRANGAAAVDAAPVASEAPRRGGDKAAALSMIPDGNHGDNLRSVQK